MFDSEGILLSLCAFEGVRLVPDIRSRRRMLSLLKLIPELLKFLTERRDGVKFFRLVRPAILSECHSDRLEVLLLSALSLPLDAI